VNAWIPKGSPFTARPLGEYTSSELNDCIDYAESHIAAEANDSAERARLQEWLRSLLGEKDDRVRVAAEMAERNRHLAQRPGDGRLG
jgi:hypothetical protein